MRRVWIGTVLATMLLTAGLTSCTRSDPVLVALLLPTADAEAPVNRDD
jgi:hypothetical protein